ncbi:peroxidase [Hydrogenophaga crassostreae]|uniref:Peroxidase n=1 Tax=Hydrogenophaga crassostreae TaxID=1763535 RepID=A0A167IRT9_9BURK|nr:carboxymuconolactone decarboxylase family protein [Hydrogenophaga crassostreae]AOW14477.1 peroxidase [Hydrogenophaga crassostreae]OAD43499.1 peroxidase [Hydrogenophaga crassostreae]
MARLETLYIDSSHELAEDFAFFERTLGFVPNSLLTMARRPGLARGLIALSRGVYDPKGEVDLGLKRLVGHVASMAAGCMYCRAHTATSAMRHGIDENKLSAIADYATSPLFSEAERAALDFALAAASVPNGVTDELFKRLQTHWSEGQIVEILGVIGLFGFFNRWNDSLATTLEAEPMDIAKTTLGPSGWNIGKHSKDPT